LYLIFNDLEKTDKW